MSYIMIEERQFKRILDCIVNQELLGEQSEEAQQSWSMGMDILTQHQKIQGNMSPEVMQHLLKSIKGTTVINGFNNNKRGEKPNE